jgi:AraC family transcriptional regulator of adaptative response / DNA-3-methyladenine glycosylase II
VQESGKPLTSPIGRITHTFPETSLRLDRDADREDARRQLRDMPGICPWTADYVLMRGYGDPDVFIPDLRVRRALHRLGGDPDRWRPWRSSATFGLWAWERSRPP